MSVFTKNKSVILKFTGITPEQLANIHKVAKGGAEDTHAWCQVMKSSLDKEHDSYTVEVRILHTNLVLMKGEDQASYKSIPQSLFEVTGWFTENG